MSGGVVQLVAVGPQDAWLTGKPEVSFYRSNYKRYTHFSNSIERQVIQGAAIPGGISTIRFEKKGDLLSYVYLAARAMYCSPKSAPGAAPTARITPTASPTTLPTTPRRFALAL